MRRLVLAPWGPAKRLLREPRTLLAPVLALLCLSLQAFGCGPSFEAIQEGDLRFAHCDRLDLDPNIAPSHRLHCWREWRRVYTYGQTRDRVEYAQRRIAEVVSGDTEPPFDLPTGSSRPADASHPATPNPAHVPPPAVVPLAGTDSALARDSPEGAFGPGCRSRCDALRAGCAPSCETEARGCKDCEASFESCLVHCKSQP
ncbi:MAG TPA: hypothetical protein VMG12_34065 [Polyangiaceae bacterium]|nr:hypothetical protein [Polyangiaceae bacterium]